MSDLQILPIPIDSDTDDAEIAHIYCCKDPEKSHFLCGKIDENSSPALPNDPTCLLCEVRQGTEFCPLYGRCVDKDINEEAFN